MNAIEWARTRTMTRYMKDSSSRMPYVYDFGWVFVSACLFEWWCILNNVFKYRFDCYTTIENGTTLSALQMPLSCADFFFYTDAIRKNTNRFFSVFLIRRALLLQCLEYRLQHEAKISIEKSRYVNDAHHFFEFLKRLEITWCTI